MVKKWLDSIKKQRRRIDLKSVTNKQTESTTKNSRLLAGAESTDRDRLAHTQAIGPW